MTKGPEPARFGRSSDNAPETEGSMEFWTTVDAMKEACKGAFEISGDHITIKDENRFRHEAMDKAVHGRLRMSLYFDGHVAARSSAKAGEL